MIMCSVQASNSEGYDSLTQTPNGRDKIMPFGYEKTELGPTTNFVGNHMTQGAIDLVQADLDEEPQAPDSVLRLANIPSSGPLRLSSGYTDQLVARASTVREIEHYGWEESNGAIRLSISLVIPSASAASAHLDGGFEPSSLWFTVRHSAPDGAPDIQHKLTIPHLFGIVNSEQSHMRMSLGRQQSPASTGGCKSSSSSSSSRDIVVRQQDPADDQGCAVLVMVLLAKQEPQQHWPSLTQDTVAPRASRWVLVNRCCAAHSKRLRSAQHSRHLCCLPMQHYQHASWHF